VAGVVGVVVAVGGCSTAPEPLTLADVDAADLAGQSGTGLAERCNTLPMPATLRSIDCAEGAGGGGGSTSDVDLDAGTYAVALLCDGEGSYTLTVEHPALESPATTVECPRGTDPALAEAFTLTEPGLVSARSTTTGDGFLVAMLLAVPS
jgi:hypothetical protein